MDTMNIGTPVVSADGSFVLVSDGVTGGVKAFDASNFTLLWALEALGEGVASLSLAQDEDFGAIYVKTKKTIQKLALTEDRLTPPVVVWIQDFASIDVAYGLSVRPVTSISIVGNGLAIAVHVTTTEWPYPALDNLPLSSGIVFLDRATGEIRSYSVHAGEAISEISIGMDGSVFAVHEPLLRAKSTETFSSFSATLTPLIGGISRFKPRNYLELAREASCAAVNRIENGLKYSGGWLSSPPPGGEEAAIEDARHSSALGWQAVVAFQIASSGGPKAALSDLAKVQEQIDQLAEAVYVGVPLPVNLAPSAAFSLMQSMKPYADAACQQLSML